MRRTYCFKLYKNKRNRHLHDQIDLASQIYNHCIALHKRYYRRSGKHISLYTMQKHIAKLKKLQKYQSWRVLDAQAIQNISERIEHGYQLFFRNLKAESRRRVAPPSFRKRIKYKSITLKQTGYKLLYDNRIRIGKRTFRYFKSQEIEGRIKTLTIKRDALGDIYLYFSCELPDVQPTRIMTGKIAGFDFGLKTFLVASDGKQIEMPLFYRQGQRKLAQAQRRVSSKKRGSNNRKKAVRQLARVHKKIANQRKDWHFKKAKELSDEYDFLFFEDLNLVGMKALWGRKVSDLGFWSFMQILGHMTAKAGSRIGTVGRYFPSTKLCSSCGFLNDKLDLRVRSWACDCGVSHDRDRNAAINILLEGASSSGLGDVRRVLAPAVAV
ncbi:RNA-guided endonuclease InsQ/TnpB family protein [Geoalkalibacter subterraneus]|uniref:Transposase n=1 Tax=Geoalkalibacter subterraneus TaxID=483547 RepID=A0A0B5FLF9_9BACT|nr:RNA-guided endonuclease TnpB family protein [Geoalkalibacter subterraneus]AJF08263.1 transposase [Geoalkalibacter subterraneus]